MKIFNRKIGRDYEILDKFEAGISLLGPEIKSVAEGKMILDDAFVKIVKGEAYLVNAHIHPYQFADVSNLDPRRSRKLLLHRKELLVLETKMKQKSLTIIPVVCYISHGKAKLEVALAKGKREYEKKEALKKKDIEREIAQELRSEKR